jgi:hypothetical protein
MSGQIASYREKRPLSASSSRLDNNDEYAHHPVTAGSLSGTSGGAAVAGSPGETSSSASTRVHHHRSPSLDKVAEVRESLLHSTTKDFASLSSPSANFVEANRRGDDPRDASAGAAETMLMGASSSHACGASSPVGYSGGEHPSAAKGGMLDKDFSDTRSEILERDHTIGELRETIQVAKARVCCP